MSIWPFRRDLPTPKVTPHAVREQLRQADLERELGILRHVTFLRDARERNHLADRLKAAYNATPR